jgi:hypothetical protein
MTTPEEKCTYCQLVDSDVHVPTGYCTCSRKQTVCVCEPATPSNWKICPSCEKIVTPPSTAQNNGNHGFRDYKLVAPQMSVIKSGPLSPEEVKASITSENPMCPTCGVGEPIHNGVCMNCRDGMCTGCSPTEEEWETKFDRECPPVTELLPADYGKYLESQGWSMATFEMENDRQYTRAQLYHENVKKFIRTLLSTARKEWESKVNDAAITGYEVGENRGHDAGVQLERTRIIQIVKKFAGAGHECVCGNKLYCVPEMFLTTLTQEEANT